MRFLYGLLSWLLICVLLGWLYENGAEISDETAVLSMVIGASAGVASGE